MKNSIKLLTLLLALQLIAISCGSVSACDCANILEENSKKTKEVENKAVEGNGIIEYDNDYWIDKGKACMRKYTDMEDWRIESYHQLNGFISDEAISNASKECK